MFKKGLLLLLLLSLLLLLILCLVVLFGFFLFCRFSSSFCSVSSFSSASFSPIFVLLFALFAFYTFFAIGTALFEVLKHCSAKKQQNRRLPQAHRLRPLLFVTCAVSLLGFPPLLLLSLLCRHFSFSPFCSSSSLPSSFSSPFSLFSSCFSSSSPFFPVFLSLLITSFVPLRPLLQRQLHKMRKDAVWTQFMCQNEPTVVKTLFNQFTGLMDRIEKDQNEEEKAFFKEWRRTFEKQLERHNWQKSAKNGGKTIGKRKNGEGNKRKCEKKLRFSEVSLIREVTVIKPNIVQFGHLRRYVGETVYVDFVRDFRVRMTSLGRIVPKSVRQIPYDFVTSEQIYYYENRRKKNREKRTRKAKGIIGEEKRATTEEHGDGYATIGGEEEADKMPKIALQMIVQVRPRLPTTPIPRSLPVSLLASPSTPLQEEFVPILAQSHSARANHVEQKEKWSEKTIQMDYKNRRPCWCQLETESHELAHLYKRTINGEENATNKSSDGYDEAEEMTETE
ncbi:hypothetical protein niasHT_027639 [Heterodera trifolii]|uniref:Uncharacterized protein n=1 Tax=Heterodera trifolii TaxID=157864 RepID=A0ABD2K662_9BILA